MAEQELAPFSRLPTELRDQEALVGFVKGISDIPEAQALGLIYRPQARRPILDWVVLWRKTPNDGTSVIHTDKFAVAGARRLHAELSGRLFPQLNTFMDDVREDDWPGRREDERTDKLGTLDDFRRELSRWTHADRGDILEILPLPLP
jgi:hypothetical protein